MIRRLNYTKRRPIPRERVVIRLLERPDGKQAFTAALDFEGLHFHAEAQVFVEAYRSYACQRFSFGTVRAPVHPPDVILAEFPPGALPLFRVKVVDARGVVGRMVGVLDRLAPQKPGEVKTDRISLLPVEYADLGEQVWRLDLEDGPVLALNRALPQVGELARADAAFLALAYPAILRRVLEEVLLVEDHNDPDTDPEDWRSLWLRFALGFPGVSGRPPAGFSDAAQQEKRDWIAAAVSGFCDRRRARSLFERQITGRSAR